MNKSFIFSGNPYNRVCAGVCLPHGVVPAVVGPVPGPRAALRGAVVHGDEDSAHVEWVHGRYCPLCYLCLLGCSHHQHSW